ncbi:hypothetical protein ORI98_05660 [Shewanella sp. ULN5]|uniref:hypothetical protein n=1 Tax=Shewanella sp. ULN5 TaxID=2994678 RepID=UPI00273D5B6D|nr:hypothetical protein [Shewanella sp. ULN5]MDP5145923.1 hypothetical protein [Shewanella sp. ULN5]
MTHTLKQTSIFHKFSGLHKLQKNNEKFNQCLNEYQIYKNQQETALAKRHNLIEAIGLETKLASIPLNKAEKILGYSIKQEAKDESTDGFNDASPKTFKALKTVNNQIASIIAKSSGSGALVSLGSWSLVSTFGAASTGTAIASLSGVAATNATLAWFGFGSIAAGGFGMALGQVVLAGILIFSVLGLCPVYIHWKSKRIKLKLIELENSLRDIQKSFPELMSRLSELEHKATSQKTARLALEDTIKVTELKLYPRGTWSYRYRWCKFKVTGKYFNEHETGIVDTLNSAVHDYLKSI